MGFIGGDDGFGREQEDPGIPQEMPLRQHGFRLLLIGFFDKPGQALRYVGGDIGIGRQLKIAIAGFGAAGGNAEGDQIAGLGAPHRRLHRGAETFGIGNHVIRGRHQQEGLGGSLLASHNAAATTAGAVLRLPARS